MDNPEYTFQILEVFSKIKTKEIPRELEEYICYVARTGDPVFQWSLVKVLIKEKLLSVLNEFMESNPSLDIPPCPNVDPFNYEALKSTLLTRLDSFILPPFTIQRICELLAAPRKEYNRIDKYMRAVEKNVLVVSACELSIKRGLETDGNEAMINGILYDKVNDSLNAFSNHVFPDSEQRNDELNVSGKLDGPETDAVQQMLDETWNDGNGEEFKLSDSGGVNFDNELHFVTDKESSSSSGDKVTISEECEARKLESNVFAEENDSSVLGENSLQGMITESSNVSYDNANADAAEATTSREFSKDEVHFTYKNDDEDAGTAEASLVQMSENSEVLPGAEEPEPSFNMSDENETNAFTSNEQISLNDLTSNEKEMGISEAAEDNVPSADKSNSEFEDKQSFGYDFADMSAKSDGPSGEFGCFESELSEPDQRSPLKEVSDTLSKETEEIADEHAEASESDNLTNLFDEESNIPNETNETDGVPSENLEDTEKSDSTTEQSKNLTVLELTEVSNKEENSTTESAASNEDVNLEESS